MELKEGHFMETYKVRFNTLGEDHMMYITGCNNRADALRQTAKMESIGIKIWSVRKVKNDD